MFQSRHEGTVSRGRHEDSDTGRRAIAQPAANPATSRQTTSDSPIETAFACARTACRVTAIIVNYHSAAMTLRAVSSLERQDAGPLDVVVVDNSECPREAMQLQREALAGRYRLLVNARNEGFGRACNRAFADSDGELVLLLNPDAWLRDGALSALVDFLDGRPEVAAAGPRISMDDAGQVLLPPARLPSPWDPVAHRVLASFHALARHVSIRERRRTLDLLQAREPVVQRALSGAVVLLRRSAVEQAGGLFDPAYPLYYEDSDLFCRLRTHGLDVYLVPAAGAVHHYDQCGRQAPRRKRELGERAWQVFRRRHDPRGRARRAQAWIERLLPAPALPRLESRGPSDDPPASALKAGRAQWVLEISHNPWFIPAAVQRGHGTRAYLGEQAWRLLAATDYYCRLGASGQDRDLQVWQVRKPEPAATVPGEGIESHRPVLADSGGITAAPKARTLLLSAWLAERVVKRVNGHPARVAVLGAGVDLVAARLSDAGHTVCPLDEQDVAGRDPAAQRYRLVVVSQPPPRLDPVEWLRAARRIVDDDGELWAAAPLGRRLDAVEGRLFGHDYLRAVAARSGWTVTSDEALAPERGRVGGDGADQRLLRMVPRPAPRWTLCHVTGGDYDDIGRLFQDVFDHSLPRRTWEWKYAESGGAAVAARREGRLVAHYGGIPRRVRLRGRVADAVQICDVMVQAKERGVLTRRGPFVLTATTFAERYVGRGRPWALAFGFPSRRHADLGRRLGLYEDVAHVVEVVWKPLATRPRLTTRIRSFDERRDAAAADVLWNAMARDLDAAVVGVRDFEYLKHRYLRHPERAYRLFAVCSRLTGAPRAILAMRVEGGRCELLDVVAPLHRLPEAVLHARRMCARLGADELYLWVTRHNLPRMPQDGRTVRDPDIAVPTIVWRTGVDVAALRDRWWITGGDTDFR